MSNRVVGYSRVSTNGQADGHGLDAQRSAILRMIGERDWRLVELCSDVESGSGKKPRPGLDRAIYLCESGQADALVVTKLDRLSRSVVQFGDLLERSRSKGWALVIGDLGVDTTTPMGEAMAGMVAVFAQLERRRISERTKEGLAVARAKGKRLGSPPLIDSVLADRIRALRASGLTLQQVSDELNRAGVPTPAGGVEWRPSSFRRVLA